MTAAIRPEEVTVVWVDHFGSDWLGIYVSGEKVYEGHPPSVEDAFALVGITDTERTFPSDGLLRPGRRGLPHRLPREVVSKEPGE